MLHHKVLKDIPKYQMEFFLEYEEMLKLSILANIPVYP
jgi:hypothetical protein